MVRKLKITRRRQRRTRRRKLGGGETEITRYYMDGCPACEMSEDAWQTFKKTRKAKTVEVESANIPESANIKAFPTYVVRKGGKETNRKVGAITDPVGFNQLL